MFSTEKKFKSQVLNIVNHIENDYGRKLIIGVEYIDLSAAYHTINHTAQEDL